MQSAYEHPLPVEEYLAIKCTAGRVVGPLPFPHAKISPFGVIPKHNQWGKWRLILNLSAPKGASINDGIARQLCSLSYVTVDDIAATVLALGQGSLLSKFDIKLAYCTVPVHPDDCLLLASCTS